MSNKKPVTLHELVQKYKINQPYLAQKIGMPVGTFKNKMCDNLPGWRFTPEERKKVVEALQEMADGISLLLAKEPVQIG